MTAISRASPNGLAESARESARVTRQTYKAPNCIVLVGLPGAGKSTVGPLVAARLGWAFVDLDVEIAREAGRSVTEIFATQGEATFRRLEREATQRLAGSQGLVLATGGGWMLDPANTAVLGSGVCTVYLRVSPDVALGRMADNATTRPLLATSDPLGALHGLLEARESTYLQANHTLVVESMAPDLVADTIVALVSSQEPH